MAVSRRLMQVALLIVVAALLTACNLGRSSRVQQVQITRAPESAPAIPTATNLPAIALATVVRPTAIPLPTGNRAIATLAFIPPTSIPLPTNTLIPINIAIQSPFPNSTITGNRQVLGSAIHPGFMQFLLEYASEPNPQNLWYPIGGSIGSPVVNNVLGVWNTTNGAVPDGLYSLRLRVFLLNGTDQSVVVSNLRVQNQASAPPAATLTIAAPVAEFAIAPDRGLAPLTVTFTNRSYGNLSSYHWDFGDSATSNELSPLHTYVTPGQYRVVLTVTGPGGSSSFAQNIIVDNQSAPVASFEVAPASGSPPLNVRFSNTSQGAVTDYQWNFGDGGSTSTEENPAHTYQAAGTYNAELLASGPGGQSNAIRQIVVSDADPPPPSPPEASFTADPQAGFAPLIVNFTNTSVGADIGYVWDFESDGAPDTTESNPTNTYEFPGVYNVTLVAAGEGGSDSATLVITVAEALQPPTASFSASVASGETPLSVTFTNESAGEISAYEWDFQSDGIVDSTDLSPTFVFDSAGTFVVTLRAIGPDGTNEMILPIVVHDPVAAPLAAFSASVTAGDTPLQVTFANQSSGEASAYEWDFQSDGIVDSAEFSPAYIFDSAGTFVVTLRAIGPGGSNEMILPITVNTPAAAPIAGFSISANDLVVSFVSTASGEPLTYHWDFGDGAVSAETSPIHSYDAGGSYRVAQTVTNAGGSDTVVNDVTVSEPFRPLVSAGEKIAFTSDRDGNNEIYVMDTNGANPVNLTNHPSNDRHPSWSPDGSLIAFASRRDGDALDLYLLDAATLAVTRLTSVGANMRPVWSPDGGRIAFVSNRFGDNDIMVMQADGSRQIQLTFDVTNDDHPSWSPDGNAIAYAAGDTGERDIHVVSAADGTAVRTLTDDAGDDFMPAWLNKPGASLLAFVSTRSGNQDIYLIDPQTGEGLRQITNDSSNERQPSWSSDGSLIIFISDRVSDGERNIYTMTADGTNLQRLTGDGSNDREPKWR